MRRTFGLALAAGLLAVSAASADIPLPKDVKYVDPMVRFDGVSKHPDHVFVLRFLTFTGGPANILHTVIEVKDDKAFNLNAQRRLTDMSLLAMDRKAAEKAGPTIAWTEKTPGILAAKLVTPPTTAPATQKEPTVTTYAVAIKDGKLTAEMARATKPGSAPPPQASLPPVWAVGVVAACSVAWFGLWFVRRGRQE